MKHFIQIINFLVKFFKTLSCNGILMEKMFKTGLKLGFEQWFNSPVILSRIYGTV